ncbi:MFS transporter [Rhodococcus sp. H29-C3]|uniref:MFS transporter n=1 Tax=Rhodococcus sp. H29-C3 TaxID=3046307 RepID=UPI0024B891AD|nr:MFS transporter [Rhodococcus sp. H29-C3]MDJ0362539.1 MFS transporter [Rhodococcus sp. H29-C3]
MSVPVRTRRQTVALWTIFFVNGAVLASWAPRIPQVKSELSLTDGQMGWALLGVAAGSVPALIGTARLLRSVSARSVCINSSVIFAGALPLIALAPNGWSLGIALAVLGAASGCLDVAMNTAAIEYQNREGKRILSRLHGGYSLGVLAGAASGAIASKFGITVFEHFAAVSVVLLALAVSVSVSLPISASRSAPPAGSGRAADPAGDGLRSVSDRVAHMLAIPAVVGLMAIAALLVEGMVTDWSALMVSRDFAGGATVGATAIVVFSSAMFLSRSFGDFVIERLGSQMTLVYAALVIATSTLVGVVLQQGPWGVVVAMGLIGIALGPLFPLLITEAGRRSRAGIATATARVSAIGYGAYLGGPPLVGFLADHTGLPSAFVLVACTCSIVLVAASSSLRRHPSPVPSSSQFAER